MFSDVLVVWLCESFGFCVWRDSRMASSTGSASCHVDTTFESGADRRRSRRARGVCDVLRCAGCLVV